LREVPVTMWLPWRNPLRSRARRKQFWWYGTLW
jgi:hypothetical protein